jgi:hypothetical protein
MVLLLWDLLFIVCLLLCSYRYYRYLSSVSHRRSSSSCSLWFLLSNVRPYAYFYHRRHRNIYCTRFLHFSFRYRCPCLPGTGYCLALSIRCSHSLVVVFSRVIAVCLRMPRSSTARTPIQCYVYFNKLKVCSDEAAPTILARFGKTMEQKSLDGGKTYSEQKRFGSD